MRDFIRPVSLLWWLKNRRYFLFMIREWTCIFVGGYALFLLALAANHDTFSAFSSILDSPLFILFQLIAFPMVLYHSITWFNLTPKVMVIWRGEERVNPKIIVGANILLFLIVSISIFWIVFYCCNIYD